MQKPGTLQKMRR